jgi:hypothetical protein
MIRFIGQWMAHCLQLTCMLAGALLFMQVPALTHAYTVALLQVAQDARRDIDRREDDARRYYHLPPDANDQAVIAALQPVEPSNATTLQQSVARAAMFDATHARIIAASAFVQPLTAVWDAFQRPDADKLAVLRTSVGTYVPHLALDGASLLYGLIGLVLGGLLGHTSAAVPGATVAVSRRLRRRKRARPGRITPGVRRGRRAPGEVPELYADTGKRLQLPAASGEEKTR